VTQTGMPAVAQLKCLGQELLGGPWPTWPTLLNWSCGIIVGNITKNCEKYPRIK